MYVCKQLLSYDGLACPGGIHATSVNIHVCMRVTTAPQQQPHNPDVTSPTPAWAATLTRATIQSNKKGALHGPVAHV
jgi:hypothetical protein